MDWKTCTHLDFILANLKKNSCGFVQHIIRNTACLSLDPCLSFLSSSPSCTSPHTFPPLHLPSPPSTSSPFIVFHSLLVLPLALLPALLLEALLGAPVLTHAAARDDEDQSQHQPEPCRQPTVNTVTAYLNRHYCIQTQNLCELQ